MDRDPIIKGDVAYIPLTRGMQAIIDAEDISKLTGVYFANPDPKNPGCYYACRNGEWNKGKRGPKIRMHRQILGLAADDLRKVDHVNGHTLDNRKVNLRIATQRENCMNRRMRSDNASGSKGVTFDKSCSKWMAQICVNGHNTHLGRFKTREAAAEAYSNAAKLYFGDFARLA